MNFCARLVSPTRLKPSPVASHLSLEPKFAVAGQVGAKPGLDSKAAARDMWPSCNWRIIHRCFQISPDFASFVVHRLEISQYLLIVLMVGIDLQANFAIDYKDQLKTLLMRSKDIMMRYEHTALRLENDPRFRFFYDATLERSPQLRDALQLNENAVVFFAETQNLLAEFADQEKDVVLKRLSKNLDN